jgi:hypothetical protein
MRLGGGSLAGIGAWRGSNRNLIVVAGDSRPVNVAEMSVSGFRVSAQLLSLPHA